MLKKAMKIYPTVLNKTRIFNPFIYVSMDVLTFEGITWALGDKLMYNLNYQNCTVNYRTSNDKTDRNKVEANTG